MAGYKRGSSRGGASGAYKKGGARKRAASEEDDEAPQASKKSKGGDSDKSAPLIPELKEDDEGDSYIKLNHTGMRRVTISEFRGTPMIHIREFWVSDGGETKPGKKGISLTVDQYSALLSSIPLIEAALAKKNVKVPRPDYDADFSAAKTPAEQEGVEEEHEAVGKVDGDDEEGE